MATGIPGEKSAEFIVVLGSMLKSRATFNELSYRRFLREIGKVNSANSASALGLFYAVAGELDKQTLSLMKLATSTLITAFVKIT